MLKRLLVFVIMALFAAALSSCALTPEDVKLKNADECKAYVEENYCPCELVSEEKNEAERKVIYTFKDTELGFTFTVISGVTSEGMDGAAFYYRPSLNCNYNEVYEAYLREKTAAQTEALCEKYGMTFEWNERSYKDMGVIYFEEEDVSKAEKAVTELAAVLNEADVRSYLRQKVLNCVGGTAQVGTYYFEDKYFMPAGSEFISEMKSALESYTGYEDMEFFMVNARKYDTIYGISGADIPEVPEKPVRAVTFHCNGEEWVITDLMTASGEYYYYRCDAAYYGNSN